MKSIKFVGIDVGGQKKGFHAVCLLDNLIISKIHHQSPLKILHWIESINPNVIAIDSPCGWSSSGNSRQSERELSINGKNISCFSTPTKKKALKSSFYKWVLNGERLYLKLINNKYKVIETYPYGVSKCFISNSNKNKINIRKQVLCMNKINFSLLKNIDEIDAGVCSITAQYYYENKIIRFGNKIEGYIYLPKIY